MGPFLLLGLIAFAEAQTVPGSSLSTATAPIVHGALDGPRTAVFTTPQDSCAPNDIPDAMARAFRDYTGSVHFVTASSDLYESLGPSLDTLQHSCEAAYHSANDINPADFNDQAWIDSFYTLDGINIAGLTHTEYHGWAIQGECHITNGNQYSACEYDSDTYHFSTDGGYSFHSLKPPGNFLAGVPYKYVIDDGPIGYSVDTNIIPFGGWYYAVATSWTWPPNCSGTTGAHPCITSGGAPLRTQDVFDPSSWRGWNGTDFSLTFVDPYLGPVSHPLQHVYTPVPYMGFVNAINVYNAAGQDIVVATLWDYWDNELGPPGMYLTTSTDLVNWTKPTLVVTVKHLLAQDPPGSWLYAYFSLLDPTAPDMNFSTVGNYPYLYYVRLNNNNVYDRVVFRQPVKLTVD
jgi:hypothetical protein